MKRAPLGLESKVRQVRGGYRPKEVQQIDPDTGLVVAVWGSMREAARQMAGSVGTIRMCCSGKRRTAYGWVWRNLETSRGLGGPV